MVLYCGYADFLETKDLYLDKLDVEKERGITVKAQSATQFYTYEVMFGFWC